MTESFNLQVKPSDGNSSLRVSGARAALIARGRKDAAVMATPQPSAQEQFIQLCRYAENPENEFWVAAHVWVGEAYLLGEIVEKDYVEAVNWFRKAAEYGDPRAEFYLGAAYASGLGLADQDYSEAVKWYLASAEQNHRAQFQVGILYARGLGIEQNFVQAHLWLSLAAASVDIEEYRIERDRVATEMSPGDLEETRRLLEDRAEKERQRAATLKAELWAVINESRARRAADQ